MIFEQFYLGCLAHASYLIGDGKEAIIVDPQRDVDLYIDAGKRYGLEIRHIIETHLHADFVSGHLELSRRTGAKIYFCHRCDAGFEYEKVRDGDTLEVGNLTLEFLETPGHTPESICIKIENRKNKKAPLRLLTGDTLFVGDVGRPDLVSSKGYSAKDMAEMLYESLQEKILPLPDSTLVYPAHGAGSACGRSIGQERHSTVGQERMFNYALRTMEKSEFVELMTENLPKAPEYFAKDAELNRLGARSLKDLPELPKFEPDETIREVNLGALLVDVRSFQEFGKAHIPDSISIQLEGPYAPWAGSLLSFDQPLILLAEGDEKLSEARVRLARVGLENVIGTIRGGLDGWTKAGLATTALAQIKSKELTRLMIERSDLQIVDVRSPREFEQGRIPGAVNIPLHEFHLEKGNPPDSLDRDRKWVFVCAGGYRSSIAASLVERSNSGNLLNLVGGTEAWIDSGLPLES